LLFDRTRHLAPRLGAVALRPAMERVDRLLLTASTAPLHRYEH
jgi:hypothetical protein